MLPGLGRRYRSSSRRTLNPLGQMPALSVEFNFTVPLQLLLCVPNVVFPFLAEMHVTDNAVHGVITEVRMYQLDHGVKVLGSQRTFSE